MLMNISSNKKSTDSLVEIGNEKTKKTTLPPISPTYFRRASSAAAAEEENQSVIEARSQSRHSSVSSNNSNIPKILEMMAVGGGSAPRRGSDIRDQRRQSQNVYDAVDLTATLLAMTHSTVDLNATKPLDDVLIANFAEKRNSSFSSAGEMMNHHVGEDLDMQVGSTFL